MKTYKQTNDTWQAKAEVRQAKKQAKMQREQRKNKRIIWSN